ncbi:hypothetical protein [Actinomadura roseirufa]|uniref:hypothetical protein n=1 Tax=Actinomadura roseirufa TaxID=2094049 RepID=UPI0010413061|nr:hypothetical protein [Actinomadura roseirufa]
MRRASALVSALVPALAAATLAPAGTAEAATGDLLIGYTLFTNPSGCFAPENVPVYVLNHTDATVTGYLSPGCTGQIEGTVPAGAGRRFYYAKSFYIP